MCTFINHNDFNECEICQQQNVKINKNVNNAEYINNIYGEDDQKSNININDDEIMKLAKIELNKFGYTSFRSLQYSVIKNLLHGKNTMLILPTGGGKSICYQIPILILNKLCNQQNKKGIGIVITPLISLMHDQVYKLKNTYNINAEYINSTLKKSAKDLIIKKLKQNEIEMLYCAPELFTISNVIIDILHQHRTITLFVIDEAHCISQWGHSFRSAYKNINEIRNNLNNPTTMICTATATEKMRDNILYTLQLDKAHISIHIGSFDRPNIYIKCIKLYGNNSNIENKIMNEIKLHQKTNILNTSIIIYCGTIHETKQTQKYLKENMPSNENIGIYHSQLTSKARINIQNQFIKNRINIVAATSAFGMGIDKNNIGLVIHKTCPSSIEEYYQQIGRAGRNGKDSTAVMIINNKSNFLSNLNQYFINNQYPTETLIRKVIKVICNKCNLNEPKVLTTKTILCSINYSKYQRYTKQSINSCLQILIEYGIIKKLNADLLPLKIILKQTDKCVDKIKKNSIHLKLWSELISQNYCINENNEISIVMNLIMTKLNITKTDLIKSLTYLKKKNLLMYDNLKRPGAIILLKLDWNRKIDWNKLKTDREEVIQNNEKMQQLIQTNCCRRKILLRYFNQNYIVGSNKRCCDNCK